GLPAGVTCQEALFATDRGYKWSFQFANDGIYRIDTTVTADDGTLGTSSREVKVDLHDPAASSTTLAAAHAPVSGVYHDPVVVTFDVANPSAPLQGVVCQLDGGAPQFVNAKSQLPPSANPGAAQLLLTTTGTHTITYHTLDFSGRVSGNQTTQVAMDL